MDPIKREQISLFRFTVIAPLFSLEPGCGRLQQAIRALAAKSWQIPYSERTSLSFKTIEGWYYAYKRGGLGALKPEQRSDAGSSRVISEPVGDLIEELLKAKPNLTGKIILSELEACGIIQPNEISLPSYYRFKQSLSLPLSPHGDPTDRRAFTFEFPNDCWQSDVLVGPKISVPDGGRRQTYLHAVIDDCSRLICHGQFYLDQHLGAFQDTIKQALLKRGVPKRLYVDNAKVFKSRALLLACGHLGIHLIHSKPYQPQGRGKIERWFRTVRSSFLARLDVNSLTDIAHLNQLLWAWVEGEYHPSFHRGIKEAPIDRWVRLCDDIRVLPPHFDLDRIFLTRVTRRVKADGTFTLKGHLYEAPPQLIRQTIDVAFDPYDLRSVWISTDDLPDFIEAYPLDPIANQSVTRTPAPPAPKPKPRPMASLEHLLQNMNPEDPKTQGDDDASTSLSD